MSKYTEYYLSTVVDLIKRIEEEESESIQKAATLMADTIGEDGLIHVIGPGGHSNMGAWEMFSRAGGLKCINAILDPGTSLQYGAKRSNVIERTPGYGVAVLKAYDVTDGLLMIVNAYGINSMTIDVALEGKRRKLPTIGVSSKEFSKQIPPDHPARHPTKKNLHELVDIHVDCHMPYGDSIVKFEKLDPTVGPVSTIVNSFALNLLVVKTVEICLEKGIEPLLGISANIPHSAEMQAYRQRAVDKYKGRIAFA